MPVYMLHGFRWPRSGFTGIRVYIVLHNLEDAAAEYIQQPVTADLLDESLKHTAPQLMSRLPAIQFIESYDPGDESSNTVSQDFAYVSVKVLTIPDGGSEPEDLRPGETVSDLVEKPGAGMSEDEVKALEELRDMLAPGEKIGWFMVYNGDPERYYPESDSEDEFEDVESYMEERSGGISQAPTEPSTPSTNTPQTPRTPQSYTVCLLFVSIAYSQVQDRY